MPIGLNRVRILNSAEQSSEWPKVEARIEQFASMSPSCATETADWFRAYSCVYVLRYSYVVEGEAFESTRVSHLGKPLWRDAAMLFQGKKFIKVAFDPADPSNSVALPGAAVWHGGLFIILTELVIGGIALAFLLVTALRWWWVTRDPDLHLSP